MKTRITKREVRQYTSSMGQPIGPTDPSNRRERRYPLYFEVSDDDFEHTHHGGFHAFPCNRAQLKALRRQIDLALK